MIVDTSAVVSVLLRERGHEDLEEKMRGAGQVAIGAPTVVEAKVVMVRRQGVPGAEAVDDLLASLAVEIVPFGGPHANVAGQALARFGKGRHPAALNYGDCMTYATARLADEPLLFIGDDFGRTDIVAA